MQNLGHQNAFILSELAVPNLADDRAKQMKDMLLRQAAALSSGGHDIGFAGVTEQQIQLHDETLICQKPRRLPDPVAREIECQCKELVELDVLEYSKSPWLAPVVPIRKPDRTLRHCVDYCKLNKVTKADRFPMLHMTELVFGLHGSEYFTTLDLVKGYYQVPLHSNSREYPAFSTMYNHYQCKQLSFGLENAPFAF